MLCSSLSSSEAEHLSCSGALTAFTLSMRSLKDATMSPLFSWCYDIQISPSGQKPLQSSFGAAVDIPFFSATMGREAHCRAAELAWARSWTRCSCAVDQMMGVKVKVKEQLTDRRVSRTHQRALHVCRYVHTPPCALAAHKFYRSALSVPQLRGNHAEQQESWTNAPTVPQASSFLLEHVC